VRIPQVRERGKDPPVARRRAIDPELLEDARDMLLHRAGGDHQFLGDPEV
jgi:hypothetical protein